ncbi:gigasin-6-like [Haliotis cracherodii]|uniref:gigasin-6-like n=1 Tax=Haliotis cracherodii TaxID=6455 RepID=UPI0039E7CC89
MLKALASLFLLLGSCVAHPGRPKQDAATFADLERYVNDVMKCRDVKGLSLALVKQDGSVYTRGFGLRDITTNAPLTETTLLNIGSESKAFTATLAADAVARKLVTWDEPLKDIFPAGFRLQDKFRSERASLRDLLSHRLGMPSYWGLSTAVMNLTLMDIAERLKDFPVRYEFRQRFLYSNYLFVVAGAALENATGETWEDGVYNRIYKPLNMTGSRVSTTLTAADWSNTAYSYTVINSTAVQNPEKALMPVVREINPAAGVYTNAVDMTKWMKFHISGGKDSTGRQVITKSVLKETHDASMTMGLGGIHRDTFPVDNLSFDYGLGWMKGIYNGYVKTFHTGEYSSYSATLTFLPDVGVGVWVGITGSRNGEGETVRDVITMYALDVLLGETPWLNSTTGCTYPAPWEPPKQPRPRRNAYEDSTTTDDPADISEYVGDYIHPAFGTFRVFQDGGQLKYSFGVLLRGDLNLKSCDQFYQTLDFPLTFRIVGYPEYPKGFPISFSRDDQGTVSSVRIPYL